MFTFHPGPLDFRLSPGIPMLWGQPPSPLLLLPSPPLKPAARGHSVLISSGH